MVTRSQKVRQLSELGKLACFTYLPQCLPPCSWVRQGGWSHLHLACSSRDGFPQL